MSGFSKRVLILTPLIAALGLAGCGGDSTSAPPQTTTTINGVAMAGPVAGQVCAYSLGSTGSIGATALACANTTPSTGAYSLSIADYVGQVILAATGTYTDEATGQTMTLTAQNPLRSLAGWSSAGGNWNVAITPLTEAALRGAQNAGVLSQANFSNALFSLATALGLNSANADEAIEDLIKNLPSLSGANNEALGYAALLDLFSTAQSQYCASNANCTLFDYLNQVTDYLGSQAGMSQFSQAMQQAYTAWQTAQANAPYVCTYTGGMFSCVPNSGGGGNGGGGDTGGGGDNGGGGIVTGNYNLNLIVTAMGVSTPIQIANVPKPNTQDEFCSSALEMAQNQASVPGATWTMNSCTFDGMHGEIAATVNITSPIVMSIPYTVHYTYTAM